MSNTFMKIISDIDKSMDQSRDLSVTAYVGGEKGGRSVQLTLTSNWKEEGRHTYICLNEHQIKELIKGLQGRIFGDITATEYSDKIVVTKDGFKEEEN